MTSTGTFKDPTGTTRRFLLYEGSDDSLEEKLRIIKSHVSRPTEKAYNLYLPNGTAKIRKDKRQGLLLRDRGGCAKNNHGFGLIEGTFYTATYDGTGEEETIRYIIDPTHLYHPN
ncbi:MAG: hypothetical protein ACLFO2_03090 [Candidatus Woesearchaeota archaeon]